MSALESLSIFQIQWSAHLDGIIVVQVCVQDVNPASCVLQLLRHALLGGIHISDQSDDGVVRLAGKQTKEFPLSTFTN